MRDKDNNESRPWLQMILPGLIAGAVAWGGMSIRMNNVEQRAQEDRAAFSEAMKQLTQEVSGLRWELQREREQRLTDRLDRPDRQAVSPVPVFPHNGRFDK